MVKTHAGHPIFARIYPRVIRAAERVLAARREEMLAGLSGHVIDVGAGTGASFPYYPGAVTRVVAVEPEPRLRTLARAAAEQTPVPVDVVDSLAERLPAADASLDAAVVSLVLGPRPRRAINDTPSVVAAAYAYGSDAGAYSIVVKLTRTLMLIPVVIVLAVLRARKDSTDGGFGFRTMPWRKIVPMFLIGFILASGVDTLGAIPNAWHPVLSLLGTFLITTALAGIGLSLRLADMRKAGHRPLLLGALLWIAVAASSLGLQAITGTFT